MAPGTAGSLVAVPLLPLLAGLRARAPVAGWLAVAAAPADRALGGRSRRPRSSRARPRPHRHRRGGGHGRRRALRARHLGRRGARLRPLPHPRRREAVAGEPDRPPAYPSGSASSATTWSRASTPVPAPAAAGTRLRRSTSMIERAAILSTGDELTTGSHRRLERELDRRQAVRDRRRRRLRHHRRRLPGAARVGVAAGARAGATSSSRRAASVRPPTT